jgi:phosphatidylglycerophosphatase A
MGREISKEEKIIDLKKIIATGFFIGYIPIAPATFSCIISILIWYFLIAYPIIYIVLTIGLIVLGIVISNDLSKILGKDPREIVIDEYACLLIPLYFTPPRILPFIITFVLFRVFDILKPFPINKLEDLKGGWGIMFDDLGAAIYTTIILLVVNVIGIRL